MFNLSMSCHSRWTAFLGRNSSRYDVSTGRQRSAGSFPSGKRAMMTPSQIEQLTMTSFIPFRSVRLLACLGFWSASNGNAAAWPPQVDQYYKAGFTADKVPERVRASIAAMDNRDLPFKEMTYRQSAVVRIVSGSELTIETSVVVIPQGGSLVAIVGTDESTEDYASVQFELDYRGLVVLRDQKYFPNAPIVSKTFRKLPPDHSPIMAVDAVSFAPNPPVLDSGSRLTIDFEVAPTDAPSRREKLRRICHVGEGFSASTIDEGLSGGARMVECDLFDDSGNSRDLHQEKIYLEAYGVALPKKIVTSKLTADFRISNVHVER